MILLNFLNQNEINQINNLPNTINKKLEQFINIKSNIEELINKIKLIKGNFINI